MMHYIVADKKKNDTYQLCAVHIGLKRGLAKL